MPVEIGKEEVRRLLESGAQLVEVLSEKAYANIHIAGAANLPLAKLDPDAAAGLDQGAPIIVYCADYQ